MKRVDSLVKKVELFEKLAKHGDRGSFLRSLAQEGLPPGSAPVLVRGRARSLVERIRAIMSKANIQDENISNLMGNVLFFGKNDPESISQAADAAKKLMTKISPLAYADAAKDQNELKDISAALNAMVHSNEDKDFSPGGNVGNKAVDKSHSYTPIDEKVQSAISKITVTEGVGLPLNIDGNLGTETRKAITRFKKYILKNEAATDQEAFQKALELVKDPKYNV